MCSTLSSIHSVSVSPLLCSLTGFSIFLHTTALTRVKPLPTPLLSYNKCLQSPCSFQYSQFSLCILYILVLYSIFWFYLLCVIKYMSSWSSTYLYIHNSLIVSLLYSRSCSLSSIHNSVSDSCILVLYLLYSGSLSSVIKYASSWSSTYLYIHNSFIFSLLYSMSYSLSAMHVSIYLQFNHLSVLISTCFSLQCLVCSAHLFRYSIVSAPVHCFQIHYNSSHKYTVMNTVTTHQQRSSIHVNVNFPPYTLCLQQFNFSLTINSYYTFIKYDQIATISEHTFVTNGIHSYN